MPEPYYNYTTNPVTQNDPNTPGHWESTNDWPKTFQYVANQGYQGLHPAAPVYQTNQSASSNMYYYAGNSTSPAGYYVNGAYYGTSAPTAPAAGWPYTSTSLSYYTPQTTSLYSSYYNYSYSYPHTYSPYYTAPVTQCYFPQSAAAAYPATGAWHGASAWPSTGAWQYGSSRGASQAAAAVAANAALAQAPSAPYYFVGSSAADIQAQNAIIAAQMMAAGQPAAPPNQLVPYKPGDSPQFWCKELDGSWTLREIMDFAKGDLSSGRWEMHPTSGYRYFVKTPV